MHKVEISYTLGAERSPDALLRNPLMDMLHAVRDQGSIAKAAKALDLSYRGVWAHSKTTSRPWAVRSSSGTRASGRG